MQLDPTPRHPTRTSPLRRGDATDRQGSGAAVLCLAFLLLSGCISSDATPDERRLVDEEVPRTQGVANQSAAPDSADLRKFADALAYNWNSTARLVLISAFEGNLTDPPGGGDPNRWVKPFNHQPGPMADGRSPVWAYTYAVFDTVHEVADAVCSTGVHAEIREGYVVIVREDGTIASAYTTRNDDEGAPPTGAVPDGIITSAEAASMAAANTNITHWADRAVWSRTFLVTDWFEPGPIWLFIVENDQWRIATLVDALTGDVIHHGGLPGAKC